MFLALVDPDLESASSSCAVSPIPQREWERDNEMSINSFDSCVAEDFQHPLGTYIRIYVSQVSFNNSLASTFPSLYCYLPLPLPH